MTTAPPHLEDGLAKAIGPADPDAGVLSRARRAFTQNTAATRSDHEDRGLRGRTYPVPFERVWQAAVALASGGLRGWRLLEADDQRGLIRVEATTLVLRFVDDVRIHISLDRDAQTRVDARSASRTGKADLGTNARRLRRFFRKLDRSLGRG